MCLKSTRKKNNLYCETHSDFFFLTTLTLSPAHMQFNYYANLHDDVIYQQLMATFLNEASRNPEGDKEDARGGKELSPDAAVAPVFFFFSRI